MFALMVADIKTALPKARFAVQAVKYKAKVRLIDT